MYEDIEGNAGICIMWYKCESCKYFVKMQIQITETETKCSKYACIRFSRLRVVLLYMLLIDNLSLPFLWNIHLHIVLISTKMSFQRWVSKDVKVWLSHSYTIFFEYLMLVIPRGDEHITVAYFFRIRWVLHYSISGETNLARLFSTNKVPFINLGKRSYNVIPLLL